MNNLIKTSTHFNLIKSNWATSSQSPRCKSTLIPCDEYIYHARGPAEVSKGTGSHRQSGWIQASHHVLYNIIRNKEPSRGFIPATKVGKNDAYRLAVQYLQYIHQIATNLQETTESQFLSHESYERMVARNIERVTTFLEPFGGSISVKQFVEMDLTTHIPVDQKPLTQYNTINTESIYYNC